MIVNCVVNYVGGPDFGIESNKVLGIRIKDFHS